MAASRIKYLSENQIQRHADDFLSTYHPKLTLPVPIEDIVELGLKINIVPIPNLKYTFGVDSYITSNFKQIVIDKHCYDHNQKRCNFTYAHELAHYVLHREFYETGKVKDINSYLGFQDGITDNEIKKIEIQAYLFAGNILVPNKGFRETFNRSLEELGGIQSISVESSSGLIQMLKQKYDVSSDVIEKQIRLNFPDFMDSVWQLA